MAKVLSCQEEGMRIGEEKEEWVASVLRGSRRNKNATYLLLMKRTKTARTQFFISMECLTKVSIMFSLQG